MIDEEKTFSPGFQEDVVELLEKCMNHQTDSITITLDYGKAILDIDMTFKLRRRGVEEYKENNLCDTSPFNDSRFGG